MYTNSHISLNVKCTKNHFVAEFCLCHRGAYSIPAHPTVIYRGKRKDGIDNYYYHLTASFPGQPG